MLWLAFAAGFICGPFTLWLLDRLGGVRWWWGDRQGTLDLSLSRRLGLRIRIGLIDRSVHMPMNFAEIEDMVVRPGRRVTRRWRIGHWEIYLW